MRTVPTEVSNWITARKGWRTPRFMDGQFASYAESKMAMCWGNPEGGYRIAGTPYRIAVCQPSPQSKGDIGFLYYDFADDSLDNATKKE